MKDTAVLEQKMDNLAAQLDELQAGIALVMAHQADVEKKQQSPPIPFATSRYELRLLNLQASQNLPLSAGD